MFFQVSRLTHIALAMSCQLKTMPTYLLDFFNANFVIRTSEANHKGRTSNGHQKMM